MGAYNINLTNKHIKIAENPEFNDDVMFCEGYEGGIACCDFGGAGIGRHALGIGSGVDRQCAIVTLDLIEIIDWSDDYLKILEGKSE